MTRLLTGRGKQQVVGVVVGDSNLVLQLWVALSRIGAEVHRRLLQGACNPPRALLRHGLLFPWSFSCEYGGRPSVDQRYH